MWSFDSPDKGVECERYDDPDRRPMKRSAYAQFPTAALEGGEVDSDCNEDANVKRNPEPDARRHGGQVFMPRGAGQSQIALKPHAAYTSHRTSMSD